MYSGWEIHGRLLRKAWTPAAKVNGWDEMSGGIAVIYGLGLFQGMEQGPKKSHEIPFIPREDRFSWQFSIMMRYVITCPQGR